MCVFLVIEKNGVGFISEKEQRKVILLERERERARASTWSLPYIGRLLTFFIGRIC